MRVLAASSEIDPRDGGFGHCVPGELLGLPPFVCERPGCGCWYAFAGLSSGKACTLAEVRDFPELDEAVDLGIPQGFLDAVAYREPGVLFVAYWPEEAIVPLDEWVDRHGLTVRPESAPP